MGGRKHKGKKARKPKGLTNRPPTHRQVGAGGGAKEGGTRPRVGELGY